MNHLNLQLQGKNKNIFELVCAVKLFTNKLEMLITNLKNKNLNTFKRTAEVFNENLNFKLDEYVEVLENLLTNCKKRFSDFAKIEHIIELHNNPLLCNINNQSNEIKVELDQMINDISLPLANGIEFWKKVDEKIYPKTKNEILKLYSMFGSTYICESSFSFLKLIKTKTRNSLSENNIENLLRIKCCPYSINIDEVINNTV